LIDCRIRGRARDQLSPVFANARSWCTSIGAVRIDRLVSDFSDDIVPALLGIFPEQGVDAIVQIVGYLDLVLIEFPRPVVSVSCTWCYKLAGPSAYPA